jgi:hypothetical protein
MSKKKAARRELERQIKIAELQMSQMEDAALTKERTGALIVYKSKRGWKTR